CSEPGPDRGLAGAAYRTDRGFPSTPSRRQCGYRRHRCDLRRVRDRHELAALPAVASLARHSRINLEPRATALAEKHDAHRVLPFENANAIALSHSSSHNRITSELIIMLSVVLERRTTSPINVHRTQATSLARDGLLTHLVSPEETGDR